MNESAYVRVAHPHLLPFAVQTRLHEQLVGDRLATEVLEHFMSQRSGTALQQLLVFEYADCRYNFETHEGPGAAQAGAAIMSNASCNNDISPSSSKSSAESLLTSYLANVDAKATRCIADGTRRLCLVKATLQESTCTSAEPENQQAKDSLLASSSSSWKPASAHNQKITE